MVKLFAKHTKPAAQPPGTMEFQGKPKVDLVTFDVIDYGLDHYEERRVESYEECFSYRDKDSMTWINVNGLHETDGLKILGAHFGLHALVLEDIVNTHQRPKVEDFDGYLYLVSRMLNLDSVGMHLDSEQVSLVIGPNFVLTFQERPGDVFDPVRERLRKGKGRIRKSGPGYLGYALLDAVVDQYFHILEEFGSEIETLEEALLGDPVLTDLQRIHLIKRELVMLRRAVWPLREVVASLGRDDYDQFHEQVTPYLRDLYDHTIQVADAVDSYRDILSGLQDLYMSSVSNRMNDVMKVLTIFASIFVPLTFVAGVYGMNFEHMPELAWRWSYPVFWGVIVVLGGGLLVFFKRKKWL